MRVILYIMKKTIFVFVFLCFFIFNSFAQNMKFTYEGTRIDNFGMKSYDPERGSIEVDFYSKNIKIYWGPYKVGFSASPIYFKSVHQGTTFDENKALVFSEAKTVKDENCAFYINLDRKRATFERMGNNGGLIIHFEGIVFIE